MPDKLADHRRRISMADDVEIIDAMRQLAIEQDKTLTDVYAEAAREFLQKQKTTETLKTTICHKTVGTRDISLRRSEK